MTMIANMFWVQSELRHYLEPANSRGKNTRELFRVFGETQEIEFVQSNDGQSLTALQTYHFSPISKDVLFMRAKLVWTTFHWYSTQSLLIVWQGTRAILFYSFIYLFLFLTLKERWNLVMTTVKGSKVIVSVKSYPYLLSSVGNFMGRLEGERPVMQSEVLIDGPDSYQK